MTASRSALLSIIAHARSGALARAWALFEAHGLEAERDDPAVLAVRGRLLKDRAQEAAGPGRAALFREAAAAYARAGELGEGATYPLINAASLSLLAGDAAEAGRLAARVLDLIDSGRDGPETPYYREATRAEALLLQGRVSDARTSLEHAVALAPRAWEDHATTLRQFGLILEASGGEAGWLDALRPPRCLHFAGHMALAAGAEADRLAAQVAEVARRERVGFAYGALAAGADIVAAEALRHAGVELHVVLPCAPGEFRRASVDPAGPDWTERFERLLQDVDTLRVIPAAAVSAASVQIGAEVAMGCATMQARTLQTEAMQLLVLSENPPSYAPGGTTWAGEAWRAAGRRQVVLAAPRNAEPALAANSGERSRVRPAAILAMRLDDPTPGRLQALRGGIEGGGQTLAPARWAADTAEVAFARPEEAAAAAAAIVAAFHDGVRVAAHYAVAELPLDSSGAMHGLEAATPSLTVRVLSSTPPGAVHVSDDFAAALAAAGGPGRTEYLGDLPSDDVERATGLYALRP